MIHMARLTVLVAADLVVVSGGATKDWVWGLMSRKEAGIGERLDWEDAAMNKAGVPHSRLTRLCMK